MEITERDIFNFIFYPETVSEEIRTVLTNSGNFSNEKVFYKNLKESLSEDLPAYVKQKLAEKIPLYKQTDIIVLYPIKEIEKRYNKPVMAAASAESDPEVVTKTFFDEDKSFIIKVLNFTKSSKIFVFSTQQEVIKNFDLVVQPDNQRFHFKDNSLPLELSNRISPESISIEFNLLNQG